LIIGGYRLDEMPARRENRVCVVAADGARRHLPDPAEYEVLTRDLAELRPISDAALQ
jgi:hypothetical protein